MQEHNSKPRRPRSMPSSPRRHHISDSQFQFSYDLGIPEIRPRPLTGQTWTPVGEAGHQVKTLIKRSTGRRPDGNPVTGEGYEPQHYRPNYYGRLEAKGGDTVQVVSSKDPPKSAAFLTERAVEVNVLAPNTVPGIPPPPAASQRRVASAGPTRRQRAPPGGYSDGLW